MRQIEYEEYQPEDYISNWATEAYAPTKSTPAAASTPAPTTSAPASNDWYSAANSQTAQASSNPFYTPTPTPTPTTTVTPNAPASTSWSAAVSPIGAATGVLGSLLNTVAKQAIANGETPPAAVTAGANIANTAQQTLMPAPVMTSATPSPAPTPKPTVDIGSWYRNTLGREARADEIAYYQNMIGQGNSSDTMYAAFLKDAEKEKAATAAAAAATTPPRQASGTTGGQVRPADPAPTSYPVAPYVNVAAWYLNELGRMPSTAETAYWQDALTKSPDPQTVYAQFAASAKANGETVTPVSWAQANSYTPKGSSSAQLVTPTPAAPAVDWTKLAEAMKAPDIDWSKLTVPQIDWSTMPTIPTTDWSTLTPKIDLPTMPDVVIPDLNPTQIKTQDLAVRNILANETVDGQLQMLLAENSPVLQQQRAMAMRAAADRGMQNSALAASGADNAMTTAATGIATQDAATYGKAADYNTTATNQAIMWNADTAAQAERLQAQLKDAAATRQQQLYTAQMSQATEAQKTQQQLLIAQMQDNTQRAQYAQQMAQAQITDSTNRAQLAQQLAIAQMQDATTRANAAQQLAIAQMQDATNRSQQSNQLTIAQMQDATTRFQSELNSSTSRYNTDASYKQQMDSQRNSLANNLIMNMDLSPDRKAAMLEQLGLGTSAGYNADGSIKYGTGLAGAVYVIGSTSSDLNFSGGTSGKTNNGSAYYNQM